MPAILLWFLSPIGKYIAIAGIVAVAGGGLWLTTKIKYERIGYQKALTAIAAQDLKAKGKADETHKTVSDCFDAGGDWDVIRGLCAK